MKNDRFLKHMVRRLTWGEISEPDIRVIIKTAISEDIAGFGMAEKPARVADPTTDILSKDYHAKAALCARKPLKLCGANLVALVMDEYFKMFADGSCKFTPLAKDGDFLEKGQKIGIIEGDRKSVV